ncbi:MAG TPA: transcription-repair coupling factor, partial [Thermoleptolyngbya sp. M55_K2018_002]|nr:transcription-repair coupling factor [Thermoleptolyngbya sp. M55_K2018_002]
MAFSSICRVMGRSPLTAELLTKLNQQRRLILNGIARLPKGLVASTLAQVAQRPLLVIAATLEEAGRWTAQLEAMGWNTVHFYPTSEASPYEPFDPESEMTWGQLQVLADLARVESLPQPSQLAIVSTERSLQPHLPPVETFRQFCITLTQGLEIDLKSLSRQLALLGYEKVAMVETEGQWSQRGDIIDVFPVAAELPVRLELFGDELEKIREFDPASQRSLDNVPQLVLTATDFAPMVLLGLGASGQGDLAESLELLKPYLSPEEAERLAESRRLEGARRFLGLAFERPASLLDYLPENTLVAIDEVEQCQAHGDRWFDHAEDHWHEICGGQGPAGDGVAAQSPSAPTLPKTHRPFTESLAACDRFLCLHLSELAEEGSGLNLSSRPVP